MNNSSKSYSKLYPWLVWGLAAAYFFSEYVARVSPSIMTQDLMATFKVHALALGSLSAFFYYAYVSMQVPVGMLVDKYGAHRLLTLMAGLCAGGCFIFANSTSLAAADFARFLMGFGAAFAFVGALKIATVWFPSERFGLLAGLTQAIGMLGAAFGEGPMSVVVAHLGWQDALWIMGSVLLVLAVLIGLFVRDQPTKLNKEEKQAMRESRISLVHALGVVLRNPQSWLNSAYAGLLYAPTAAFAELWGVSYLSRVYNLSTEVAASAISMIFIGWVIGGPIAGLISDKLLKRLPLMYFSVIACLITMSIVLYSPHLPVWSVFVLLFIYGLCNTGVAISYAVASENNPHHLAGTSMAFTNMASVLVGAAFQPIIGWFLDLQWKGEMVAGAPFYSAHDFRVAMMALPVCLLLGLGVNFLVRETHCKIMEKN